MTGVFEQMKECELNLMIFVVDHKDVGQFVLVLELIAESQVEVYRGRVTF